MNARRGVALRQPHDAGQFPVEVDLERGILELFLDARVRDAGDMADFCEQLVSEGSAGAKIGAGDLNVDGRGRAEIEDLTDDVGRQERELHSR